MVNKISFLAALKYVGLLILAYILASLNVVLNYLYIDYFQSFEGVWYHFMPCTFYYFVLLSMAYFFFKSKRNALMYVLLVLINDLVIDFISKNFVGDTDALIILEAYIRHVTPLFLGVALSILSWYLVFFGWSHLKNRDQSM